MGHGGGLDPAPDVELAQDPRDVDARGLGAHVQLGADLAVGAADGDEAQDLALARGQVEAVLGARVLGAAELDAAAAGQRLDLLQQRPGAEARGRGRGGAERFGGRVALPERECRLGTAPAGVGAGGRDGERIGARDRGVPGGRIGRAVDARELGRAERRVEAQLGQRTCRAPQRPGRRSAPSDRAARPRASRSACPSDCARAASASSASVRRPTQCRRAVKNGNSWPSLRATACATTSRAAAGRPAESSSSAAPASTHPVHVADASVTHHRARTGEAVLRDGALAALGRDLGDARAGDSLR